MRRGGTKVSKAELTTYLRPSRRIASISRSTFSNSVNLARSASATVFSSSLELFRPLARLSSDCVAPLSLRPRTVECCFGAIEEDLAGYPRVMGILHITIVHIGEIVR